MPASPAKRPASTSPRASASASVTPIALRAFGSRSYMACPCLISICRYQQTSREHRDQRSVSRTGLERVGCMQVSELMLRDVTLVSATDSAQSAAQTIADIDSRFVFIGTADGVVGVLTIRDILIRLVAAGLDPTVTPVSQIMSSSLFTCSEAEEAEVVDERMAEHRIEQLPVLDAAGRMVGAITRRAIQTLSPTDEAP